MKQPFMTASQRRIQPPNISFLAMPSLTFPPSVAPHLPGAGLSASRRHYNTGTALFLTRVRLWEQIGGEHPYAYVMNNPINYTDPSGNAPCKPADPCKDHTKQPGFWDHPSFTNARDKAVPKCSKYDPGHVKAILECIVEREVRGRTKDFKFPLPEQGGKPTGPCQIVPGTDKNKICGKGWNKTLQSHMDCCAKILCACLDQGGGDIVKGCGTVGQGNERTGQFETVNESDPNGFEVNFKCCLLRNGISKLDPNHIIPLKGK